MYGCGGVDGRGGCDRRRFWGGGGVPRSEGGVWEGIPPPQGGHPDFFEESMVDEFAGMFQDSDSD